MRGGGGAGEQTTLEPPDAAGLEALRASDRL